MAQGVSSVDVDAYLAPLATREAMDAAIHWYRASTGGASALAGPHVPPVTCPTLYLWGDSDASVGRMAAELTAHYVTGPYQFVTLPGLGHFLTDQAPELVTMHLLTHLRSHPYINA
jgi:pimeloyl-ACP methyl ester carboxylesterase